MNNSPRVFIEGFQPACLKFIFKRRGKELARVFWPTPTAYGNILILDVSLKLCRIPSLLLAARAAANNPTPPKRRKYDVRIRQLKNKLVVNFTPNAILDLGRHTIFFSPYAMSIEIVEGNLPRFWIDQYGKMRCRLKEEMPGVTGYYFLDRINETQFKLASCTQ